MPSYLITGSSRGLGLAFVEELLHDPRNIVIATARNPAKSAGLQALVNKYSKSRIVTLYLDITKPETIQAAALELQSLLPDGLDHLISNAGASLQSLATFEDLDLEKLRAEFDLTVVGPILLMRALLPLLRQSKTRKVMFVSSQMGSIELGYHMVNVCNSYGTAKAALNMMVRKWSAILKQEDIIAFLIHPGWLGDTDTGKSITSWVETNAPDAKSVAENASAVACLGVLAGATMEQAGRFVDYNGEPVPW